MGCLIEVKEGCVVILVMKISEINLKITFAYIIAMQSVFILLQVSQNKFYTFFREK